MARSLRRVVDGLYLHVSYRTVNTYCIAICIGATCHLNRGEFLSPIVIDEHRCVRANDDWAKRTYPMGKP